MAGYNNDKLRIMEDEMNRFEEEIGLPNVPSGNLSIPLVIGTNTFSQAQRKIYAINKVADPVNVIISRAMVPPPPPMISSSLSTSSTMSTVSSMFIPHQVHQRSQVSRQGMPEPTVPPPPPPPMITPAKPMLVHPTSAHIPPPPPPPNLTFPPRPSRLPFGFPPQPPNFIPSQSQTGSSHLQFCPQNQQHCFPNTFMSDSSGTVIRHPVAPNSNDVAHKPEPPVVVLSATPKLYTSKSEINTAIPSEDKQLPSQNSNAGIASSSKVNKKQKNATKEKDAKKVFGNETTQQPGKKREKKAKKFVRVSGGQAWEDPSLTEWEDELHPSLLRRKDTMNKILSRNAPCLVSDRTFEHPEYTDVYNTYRIALHFSFGQVLCERTFAFKIHRKGDFRLFCGDLGNDVTDELLTRIFSKYPSFLKARVVRDKRTNKTKGFGFISFKDPQDFIRATKEMNGRYVGSRPIKLRKSTWKNRNLDVVKKKEKEKAALIALLTGKS